MRHNKSLQQTAAAILVSWSSTFSPRPPLLSESFAAWGRFTMAWPDSSIREGEPPSADPTGQSDQNAIREGEPPITPNSMRARDSPSRLAGFALACLLAISFMCITAFIYVEVFPMGRLFLLYATHGPWEDRSSWGPVSFSCGLAGIVLAFASNIGARHSSQFATRLFGWLFLLMAALFLIVCSEEKLLSLLTAIPFAGVSVAWLRMGKLAGGRLDG